MSTTWMEILYSKSTEELKCKTLSCRVRVPFHFKPEMGKEMLNLAEKMKTDDDDLLSSGFAKFFGWGNRLWNCIFIDDYADTRLEGRSLIF